MIWQGINIVNHQGLGQFLDFLTAQAIDYSALAFLRFDIANEVFIYILCFRPYFIIKVWPVKRRLKHSGLGHTEVFLYVVLNLRRSSGSESDKRTRTDFIDNRANSAIFGAEIVSPLRNTVSFVDGIKRDFNRFKKIDVLLFCEGFGGDIKKFSLSRGNIALNHVDSLLIERWIQEVSHSIFVAEITHCVHLVLHQGNQRWNYNSSSFHNQRWQLVAKRLAATGWHKHKGVLLVYQVLDYLLLIAFKRIKTEMLFKLCMEKIFALHRYTLMKLYFYTTKINFTN